ncbi:aspartic proteinase Asp1-like [Magnolia sinica]|uniref:aspartic proteinase Asp1-like n=1 Tax=Magnolia sinica TaxID=86752 RepID=UPI0026586B14|nr:aspartic proteinase Asp1-like [Magnolia sinica]
MGRKEKGAFAFLLLLLLLTFQTCSAAANTKQSKKKQALSPSSSSSSYGVDSSVIFRVSGNVYPEGLYYVSISVGDPPKPYFLDVDTGSDLTWIQCNAPCVSCSKGPHPLYTPVKNKLVFCKDPLCASIRTLSPYRCEKPLDQCDYEIEYADQGSSVGVLMRDTFLLHMANGSIVQPSLAFGCGYDQQSPSASSTSLTDGVLGLGNSNSGIVSQLRDLGLVKNVIGHCLSGRGGGYLFFGDSIMPSSGVTWTPMSHNPLHKYYSPGPTNIIFGEQLMGVKDLLVAFDSGSSFTYFALQPYQAFVSTLRKGLSGKPLKEAPEDKTLPLCWKGAKKFKSIPDVKKYFKPLILIFADGKKAVLEIPPEGYLIISKDGNVCLGILNGTEIGLQDLNLIGDISLQDLMVIYDNEKQQIGWVRENCDRLPNADGHGDDGFDGGFSQPYVARMGFLTDEHPASYPPKKTKYG